MAVTEALIGPDPFEGLLDCLFESWPLPSNLNELRTQYIRSEVLGIFLSFLLRTLPNQTIPTDNS